MPNLLNSSARKEEDTRAAAAPPAGQRIVSIIDLGSNSLRMLIVKISPEGRFMVLNEAKHMVRLGEDAFALHHLQPAAMTRTMEMLHGFADMCAAYGVQECRAVATAAVRDAENGELFLAQVRERTGLDFTIISGKEEARLIWRGVAGGLKKTMSPRLFLDIGGGSTELSTANSTTCFSLDSLKLGCVRLANMHPWTAMPVSAADYARLQLSIRDACVHVIRRVAECSVTDVVASSGTAQNLAEIAAALTQNEGGTVDTPHRLSYGGLRRVVAELCARDRAARAELPRINPRRVDVLLPGAAILQTIMEELSCDCVRISTRGLRDGLLTEYLEQAFPENVDKNHSTQEESVLRLARNCGFEETHARHVAELALSLFDSARELGLHTYEGSARTLLRYAGLLHDVGIFIAFSQHHAHSYYLIRNTELLGFTERDIHILAATAFFHRVKPGKKYREFTDLAGPAQQEVRVLSLMLALAEALDKSHRQAVSAARFLREQQTLVLDVHFTAPCPLEQERISRWSKRMAKTCRENVQVRFRPVETALDHKA